MGLENSKKLLEDLPNKCGDILCIIPSVKLEKKKGKNIIVIKVEHSNAPISYHGKFYIRSGSTIQEFAGKDLSRFLILKLGKDWDEYVEENLRKMGLNERQIKAMMYVKGKSKITNKEYRELFQITDRTAMTQVERFF